MPTWCSRCSWYAISCHIQNRSFSLSRSERTYYWKREKFGYAALLAIFSIFTREVGGLILVIFLVDMLYGYIAHRERSRVIRELTVIATTCTGVAALYLFYLYRFGNPFISSQIQASPGWYNTSSVANILHNVVNALAGLRLGLVNYSAVPIILIDALAVLATVLFLLRRDLALSAYSLVSLVLFLSLSNLGGFMRFVAAIFPIYLFFGLMLSDDDWKKNITVGVIAVIIAVQNMYIWISGAWFVLKQMRSSDERTGAQSSLDRLRHR